MQKLLGSMDRDLERFAREMEQGLKGLLDEVERLRRENARLLHENQDLRQKLTLERLGEDMQSKPEIRARPGRSDGERDGVPDEAIAFFAKLPDRLSFTEYFQRAEAERIEADKAREYMLLFVRERMLQQRGRQIEKRHVVVALSEAISTS